MARAGSAKIRLQSGSQSARHKAEDIAQALRELLIDLQERGHEVEMIRLHGPNGGKHVLSSRSSARAA